MQSIMIFYLSDRGKVEEREAGDWNETGTEGEERGSESTDAEWCL